jgi:acyl carrier protein
MWLMLGRSCSPFAGTYNDLGASSIEFVSLLIALEEEFGVEFPFLELDHIHTL